MYFLRSQSSVIAEESRRLPHRRVSGRKQTRPAEVKKDMEKTKEDPQYQEAFKQLEEQRQKLRIDEVFFSSYRSFKISRILTGLWGLTHHYCIVANTFDILGYLSFNI